MARKTRLEFDDALYHVIGAINDAIFSATKAIAWPTLIGSEFKI
jgi:hypothetical protein